MRVYGLDMIKTIAPRTEMHIANLEDKYILTNKASEFLAKN
jgi:hypothetical protein